MKPIAYFCMVSLSCCLAGYSGCADESDPGVSSNDVPATIIDKEIRAVSGADGKTVMQRLTAGQPFTITGSFRVVDAENHRPKTITLKILNRKKAVADSGNSKPVAAENGRFTFTGDLTAPSKPGLYTIEAWDRGSAIIVQEIDVR